MMILRRGTPVEKKIFGNDDDSRGEEKNDRRSHHHWHNNGGTKCSRGQTIGTVINARLLLVRLSVVLLKEFKRELFLLHPCFSFSWLAKDEIPKRNPGHARIITAPFQDHPS